MTALATPELEEAVHQGPTLRDVEPEDLDLYHDVGLVELVDGRILEKTVSSVASLVANRLKRYLDAWAVERNAGEVFVEATFRCFDFAPKQIRRPDVAYVSAEKLAGYGYQDPHFPMLPDLACEVLSANDRVDDLEARMANFREAGVPRFWVVSPIYRWIRIHRDDGGVVQLYGDDRILDDEVLPGFTPTVNEIFAGVPEQPKPPVKLRPGEEG
jgi:Uma2 family endonuclease